MASQQKNASRWRGPQLKMDEFWVTDKSFPGTDKNPPTIVAKWIGEKPIRQPLPDTITSFIAVHVEKGIQINQHVIKCKEGESLESVFIG